MSRTGAWMPLYIGDYLADTAHLTLEESGAYLHVLMSQWRVGHVPSDPQKLAAICRVTRTHWVRHLAPAILSFFEERGDRLVQKRLEAERNKVEKPRKNPQESRANTAEIPAENARKTAGNTPNETGNNNEVASPLARGRARVPSQSQSQSEEERTPSSLRDEVPPGGPPLGASLPAVEEAPAKHSPARGTRLPADWQPAPDLRAFASGLSLDPDAVAARFRDYWHGVAGAKGRRAGWVGTWRNWCRREAERPPGRQASGTTSKLDWWRAEMAANGYAPGAEPPPKPPPDPHAGPTIEGSLFEEIAP